MFRIVFKNPPPWEERINKDGFVFLDRVNKPSRATFTIDNYDYKYSNLKNYRKNFVFCFGSYGMMSKWFKTDIVSVEGSRVLKIETQTMETRLMTRPMTRFYEDTTLKGVLDVVAAHWGMVGEYDPDVEGLRIDALSQVNETDAQFLRRLALSHGYNFYIDGDALHFASEARSNMQTIPYGELLEEPDFNFNFRKLRKKAKIKSTGTTAEEIEQVYEHAEFIKEFGTGIVSAEGFRNYEGPQSIGLYDPTTEKADSATAETKVLYREGYEYEIKHKRTALGHARKQSTGTKEAGGPKHEEDEIIVRSKAEAMQLAAKKVIKMTMKLPANTLLWAGDSTNLVQAPEGIEGQWFVRQHEYKWPVSTYEVNKRGLKKKIDADKLAGAKEKSIEIGYAEMEQLAEAYRDPNTSVDPLLFGKSIGVGLKPHDLKILNEDLTYVVK